MVGLAVSLVKDLRHDPKVVRREYAAEVVNTSGGGCLMGGVGYLFVPPKD